MNKIIVGVAASVITSMVLSDILVTLFNTRSRVKSKCEVDLHTKHLAALDIKIAKNKEAQAQVQ